MPVDDPTTVYDRRERREPERSTKDESSRVNESMPKTVRKKKGVARSWATDPPRTDGPDTAQGSGLRAPPRPPAGSPRVAGRCRRRTGAGRGDCPNTPGSACTRAGGTNNVWGEGQGWDDVFSLFFAGGSLLEQNGENSARDRYASSSQLDWVSEQGSMYGY